MNAATQIKKMSVATVYGKIKTADLLTAGPDGKIVPKGPVKLFRVFGRAVGTKTGISNFGEWEQLTGQFRAISESGEIFDSSALFLPDVALDAIKVALAGATAADFAIDLYAVADEKSSVGYTYTFQHVLPPSGDDPIEKLSAQIGALSLPAPTPEPEKKEEKPAKDKK